MRMISCLLFKVARMPHYSSSVGPVRNVIEVNVHLNDCNRFPSQWPLISCSKENNLISDISFSYLYHCIGSLTYMSSLSNVRGILSVLF